MNKLKQLYSVTILENDDTVFDCYAISRDEALRLTNAAEKVRNCKAWKITYSRVSIEKTK